MPNLNKLVAKIRSDYPNLIIQPGERTLFSPPSTIYYAKEASSLEILHELGHALLKNANYSSDIELVRIESEAWQKAKELCQKYDVDWNEDVAEDHIDTYRDWLHTISLCRNCQLTGFQDSAGIYHCSFCNASWQNTIQPKDF